MEKDLKNLISKFLYIYLAVSFVIVILTIDTYKNIAYLHIALAVIMLLATLNHKRTMRSTIDTYVNGRIASVESVARNSYRTFPIAILIVNKKNNQIKWYNEEFLKHFLDGANSLDLSASTVLPELTQDKIKNHFSQFPCELTIGENIYRVFSVGDSESNNLVNFYFLDVTSDVNTRLAFEHSKPIVSVISIDNYDELLRNSTDTEKSIIVAAINTRISEWTKEANGIFKKFDRDRYLFVFSNSKIEDYIGVKFPILDSIREIQTAEGITATLSIGIGRDGDTFADNYDFALNSLDMALSRGGDQVVIKNKYSFEFYGGMSKEVEKRTKVKSRVIANALNQIIKDASEVFVMGHKFSDFDSVGSAIGICAAMRNNNIPHKIVIDTTKTSATPLIEKLLKHDAYKDIFITPDDALIQLGPETLLIVVDTNRPDFVESRAVLDSASKIVVIDHHRRAADYIENATVSMHEPYASSASEIVTELLQYMVNTSKITKIEAEALLCGIMLDTKHFASKTGSRTFEAAAYLRRIGADVDTVKLLFQNDFDSYLLKQQITSTAKIYAQKFAIAISSSNVERSLASQCADEMLNVNSIKASFVIFKTENATNISARSNSNINVQVIMEKLGGGGSINAAACQFDGDTTENVERMLKQVLDEFETKQEN
ncbi:MAG: DHH family phosphoesterase [Clostridia bacterium]